MKAELEARMRAVMTELDAIGDELAPEHGVTSAVVSWMREARYCVQKVAGKLERDERRRGRRAS